MIGAAFFSLAFLGVTVLCIVRTWNGLAKGVMPAGRFGQIYRETEPGTFWFTFTINLIATPFMAAISLFAGYLFYSDLIAK